MHYQSCFAVYFPCYMDLFINQLIYTFFAKQNIGEIYQCLCLSKYMYIITVIQKVKSFPGTSVPHKNSPCKQNLSSLELPILETRYFLKIP